MSGTIFAGARRPAVPSLGGFVRLSRRVVVTAAGASLLALVAGPAAAAPAGHPRRGAPPPQAAGHRTDPRIAAVKAGKVRLGVLLRGSSHGASETARQHGAQVVHDLPALHYLSLSVSANAQDSVTKALSHRSDVLSVVQVARRKATSTPNDALYAGSQSSYLNAVNAPAAWDTTHGSSTIKVAVIDTGVDVAHPDLAGKVVGTHNAITGTTDVSDNVGHGTHVAGIIGALTNNGTGVAGTGYDTSLLAVKAGDVDGFSDDDIAEGITWAVDHGARVLNMSLGGYTTSAVLDNAIAYAQNHGALVVAAAGNDSTTAKSYPAASPGVVAVGATDAAGGRAFFSNYGSWVTVGAPGVSIMSTVPTAGSEGFPAPTSGYAEASGTSMASPIVAGEAALLLGAAPWATRDQLRAAVRNSAHGYAGFGLGTGQVDLAAALPALPPLTKPTVTAPTASAVLAGVTTLTASTTASHPDATVRFLVDGTPVSGGVSVVGGTASFDWPSWGLSNGAHQVTAMDCDADGCGGPSDAVAFTLTNTAPQLTSPTSGATVAGVVGLDITTSDAAPKVRVRIDGIALSAPVAVVSNAVHLTWPPGGLLTGAHTIEVARCDAQARCGALATTPVTVTNDAPVITSPLAGQKASGEFPLSATAASGALKFLVDNKEVGFDTTAPYSVKVVFSALADGTHTLVVQPCTVTRSSCAGPSASRSFTSQSLHPLVTKTVPTVFSPNGDKRADTTTVTYSLPTTQAAWWSIRNGAGSTVRGPYYLGTLSAGTRTFLWNGGLANGTRAPDGTYHAVIFTRTGSGASTLYGLASRAVRVDTVAPSLSLSGMVTGFYPYTDGYRDTLAPKATTNEPGLLTMTVRNSSGHVVRTITVNHSGTGAYTLTWNGRDAGGHLVPAGTYKVLVTAQDVALNRRSTATYSVGVSLKKLVGTTVTKTVTPAVTETAADRYVGSCSKLFAESSTSGPFRWAGAYDYLSAFDFFQYGACPNESDPDLDVVFTEQHLTLPAAVKYGGISMTATGREVEDVGDEAYAGYINPAGDLVGAGVTLGPAYGAYPFGAASPSILYAGKTLRWFVGTDSGQYYTVRAFTVKYTYYVLG
jgi:subtilisin family serine protease/flagellar hook assembly protein FlgD